MKKTISTLATASSLPLIGFAQVANNIRQLGGDVSNIFQGVVAVLIGLAVVVFLWGLFKYITESNNESKRQDAKNYMIYGVVAIFIMISVWGLVEILANTTGLEPFIGLPDAK